MTFCTSLRNCYLGFLYSANKIFRLFKKMFQENNKHFKQTINLLSLAIENLEWM